MWTPGGQAEERRLYKGVQESPLEQYLPLGTSVWVNHRRISASPHSSLRVQATIVMRAEEGSGDTIPQEYINTFSPFEARAALVEAAGCSGGMEGMPPAGPRAVTGGTWAEGG